MLALASAYAGTAEDSAFGFNGYSVGLYDHMISIGVGKRLIEAVPRDSSWTTKIRFSTTFDSKMCYDTAVFTARMLRNACLLSIFILIGRVVLERIT